MKLFIVAVIALVLLFIFALMKVSSKCSRQEELKEMYKRGFMVDDFNYPIESYEDESDFEDDNDDDEDEDDSDDIDSMDEEED